MKVKTIGYTIIYPVVFLIYKEFVLIEYVDIINLQLYKLI